MYPKHGYFVQNVLINPDNSSYFYRIKKQSPTKKTLHLLIPMKICLKPVLDFGEKPYVRFLGARVKCVMEH